MSLSKDALIKNFIRSIAEIEDAIEPFKEQKKELKTEYVENGWLTKDEIAAAIKAYKIVKNGEDFEELERMYNRIKPEEG